MSTIEQLLEPIGTKKFFSEHYGKNFQIFEPGVEFTRSLLSWDLLQEAMESSSHFPERDITLAKAGKGGFREPIERDHINEETGAIDTTSIYERVRDGATLVFNCINQHSAKLNRLGADMKRHLLEMPSFNCYASIRPEPGLGIHWDDHDVIAIQIEGRKFWQLYEPAGDRPVMRNFEEKRPASSDLVWEGYIEAGQCLYVPRGMWHSVLSTGIPSLHITCGFFGTNLGKILQSLTIKGTSDAFLGLTISPEHMTETEKRAYEEKARERVLALLSDGFLDQFWIDEKANLAASTASGNMIEVCNRSEAIEGSAVRSLMPHNPHIYDGSEECSIVVDTREIALPKAFVPVFKSLAGNNLSKFSDLNEVAIKAGIESTSLEAFLQSLAEEKLIEFVSPAGTSLGL